MGRILPSIRSRGAQGAASSLTGPGRRRAEVIAAGQAAAARMAGPDPSTALAPNQVDFEKQAGDRVTGFRELQALRRAGAQGAGVPTVQRAVGRDLAADESPRRRLAKMRAMSTG